MDDVPNLLPSFVDIAARNAARLKLAHADDDGSNHCSPLCDGMDGATDGYLLKLGG